MKKATKKSNPHAWFYAHIQGLEGYKPQFCDVIKEGIVSEYTSGKTERLSEMYKKYPGDYERMRSELSDITGKKNIKQVYDRERKKLIAAIFANLEKRGYRANIEYVKSVACRAAKTDRFNDIPVSKLKDIYNRFVNKNKKAMIDELLQGININ